MKKLINLIRLTLPVFVFGLMFSAIKISGQNFENTAPMVCTATWRKADNPKIINDQLTIGENETICVEAGVNIQFGSNGRIVLIGGLIAEGTATERITFTALNVFPSRIENVGNLEANYADFSVIINSNFGSAFKANNSRFGKFATVSTLPPVINAAEMRGMQATLPPFIQIENSVFDSNETEFQSDNAGIFVSQTTAVLKNLSFSNRAFFNVANSYLFVENITSQNSPIEGMKIFGNGYQATYLNNLNISNSGGAGLDLASGNFFVGSNVAIQNALYPAKGHAALMPGSVMPSTGNRNNWIEADSFGGEDAVYSRVGVPYVVSNLTDFGGIEIEPGVTLKARPNFAFATNAPARVLGLPDAPITVEPFAAEKWNSGQMNTSGDRLEYFVMDGSTRGIMDVTISNSTYYVDNSVFKNNDVALSSPTYQFAFLQGNIFTNNVVGIRSGTTGTGSGIRASGRTNPNLFESNSTAVSNQFIEMDVRYNWWNSPTGPRHANNPSGTGDTINGELKFQPFRTTRPDTTDKPPVVRMPSVPYKSARGSYQGYLKPGQKVFIKWKASDDRRIVKQKILFSAGGNAKEDFRVIADNLPAGQRSFEFNVPSVGFIVNSSSPFLRVVATDEKGQEGWDEWQFLIPSGDEPGELAFTSPIGGETFNGGNLVSAAWTITTPFENAGTFYVYLILDGDRKLIPYGSGNMNGTTSDVRLPMISTDSARFAVMVTGSSSNRKKWFFSEPFSIRGDSRFADAPPQISMISPTAGQTISAGSVLPISWTASDDSEIRYFNILSSTDGGKTWQPVVENLPANATSYNWQLPDGGNHENVRVRVVAVDRRYQNSSAGHDRAFRITAPQNAAPTVQITSPANNMSVVLSRAVFITANASDTDGTIQRVDFYANGVLIGSDSSAPFQTGWNNAQGGTFAVTARAFDNRGDSATSSAVNVTFTVQQPIPFSIPVPELIEPFDGAVYPANSNLTLTAEPGNGTQLARMEFYNGTTLIGSDTTAPYNVNWNNIPQGSYTIFAKAVATTGAEAISAGANITVGNQQTGNRRAKFDFDGDGKSDISVFRPSNAVWYLNNSTSGFSAVQWGLESDKLAPADYDGDGKTDVAIYRDGIWYLLRSSGGFASVQFGIAGDIPQPADFDGDGKAELAVYRPSNGVWYSLNLSNNQVGIIQFGLSEDKPVIGDYDGDGRADLAVFRPSNSVWYIQQSGAGFKAVQWGNAADKLVPADYDGDGKTDIAVYRGGVWYVQKSNGTGNLIAQWGIASDIAAPADYDGDGRADLAVYRNGIWYVLQTATNSASIQQFGLTNDKPIANSFVY